MEGSCLSDGTERSTYLAFRLDNCSQRSYSLNRTNQHRQDLTLSEQLPGKALANPEMIRSAISGQYNGDTATINSLYDETTDDDRDTTIHPSVNNNESPLFKLKLHNNSESKNTESHSSNRKISNYKNFKSRIQRLRICCCKFSEGQKFSLIVLLAILANTVVMAIEHHNQVRLISFS